MTAEPHVRSTALLGTSMTAGTGIATSTIASAAMTRTVSTPMGDITPVRAMPGRATSGHSQAPAPVE